MKIEASDFAFIADVMRQDAGIVLPEGKEYLVEVGLQEVCRQAGLGDIAALVGELRSGVYHPLRQRVVEALATHETSFFRDQHPFDALRERVLPEIIGQRLDRRRLDIWSCACSNGQEAYSIAITLREHFPGLDRWDVRVLATDVSRRVIDSARAGVYSDSAMSRGLPVALRDKYFVREGRGWRAREAIARMVEFRVFNLAGPWPLLRGMDIVFLRNVLIYLEPALRSRILERVHGVLADDGRLFLGATESTRSLTDRFEQIELGPSICYRKTSARRESVEPFARRARNA